jgi:hypothetical protein
VGTREYDIGENVVKRLEEEEAFIATASDKSSVQNFRTFKIVCVP